MSTFVALSMFGYSTSGLAQSVDLLCNNNEHLQVDLNASTVTEVASPPFPTLTYSAQITDSQVTWDYISNVVAPAGAPPEGPHMFKQLDRYTLILTIQSGAGQGSPPNTGVSWGSMNSRYTCARLNKGF